MLLNLVRSRVTELIIVLFFDAVVRAYWGARIQETGVGQVRIVLMPFVVETVGFFGERVRAI